MVELVIWLTISERSCSQSATWEKNARHDSTNSGIEGSFCKNISLHSAIEIIKNLDTGQRKEIISLLMESIVQILAEHMYDIDKE